MKGLFGKLNLRPQEQRLVVLVGIAVFIVLNLWFVRPYFGELSRVQQKQKDVKSTLRRYQAEVKQRDEYKRELERLQSLGGYVATDHQALELLREVDAQAVASGVAVQRREPLRTTSARTNSFFDETSLTITVNTGEKELVDFLYNLSKAGSLTRVRTLTLMRDPSQMRLAGTITFVKSFQRKPPAPAPVQAAAKAPAPKAATMPAKMALASKPPTNAPPQAAKSAPAKAGGTNAPPKDASKGQAKSAPATTNFVKRLISKWF